MSQTDYDDLADQAERGQLSTKPGTIRRGSAAAAEARKALLEAADAATIEELSAIPLGRPTLRSTKPGPSPILQVRVPQDLKDRVAAIAQREHRNESEIVREALANWVTRKGA
ncbi:ribbon-helix-helix protein, CopG family [Kocuria sp.]|uniref:ribbon-helix-helix protein, CopG family n=1 Tax=Kocuria sp. TaxID=1871328 RepID=UPI0026DFFEF5|nr:ribbon-helix-helix protein, CopG family [Kocuria sp.]MDO5618806.1 ribbon-helix-helix protein, CopG family [Kocuria sp.]